MAYLVEYNGIGVVSVDDPDTVRVLPGSTRASVNLEDGHTWFEAVPFDATGLIVLMESTAVLIIKSPATHVACLPIPLAIAQLATGASAAFHSLRLVAKDPFLVVRGAAYGQ